MPKKAHPLTAREVQMAQFTGKNRKLYDGNGLFLWIAKRGKYWKWKFRWQGKDVETHIGAYPTVSLSQARDMARQLGDTARAGVDPREAKREDRRRQEGTTFETIARQWLQNVHKATVVPSHYERNLRRLERLAFPLIGQKEITDIRPGVVLEALRRIDSPDTAQRVKAMVGQIVRYAAAQGFDVVDPTPTLTRISHFEMQNADIWSFANMGHYKVSGLMGGRIGRERGEEWSVLMVGRARQSIPQAP